MRLRIVQETVTAAHPKSSMSSCSLLGGSSASVPKPSLDSSLQLTHGWLNEKELGEKEGGATEKGKDVSVLNELSTT
jgi:hypothetical protein